MVIKATSADHAKKIFRDLKKKGYKHKMNYLHIQEWIHDELETVLVGKFYGYSRATRFY